MSYLSNRQTAVTIGNNTSLFSKIRIGVAQGSKMGPLTFLLYIHDLLRVSFRGLRTLFADDAVLVYVCDSMEEMQLAMQADIDLLHEWLVRNVLTLNTEKTCFMYYGRAKDQADIKVSYDGTDIKRVKKFKYLGLVLDEELTFKQHVDHVKKLIAPFIPIMWRNGRYIPMSKRRSIYLAYVHSHISYMLPIYGDCCQYKLNELKTLQNRCIMAHFGLPRLTSTTYLYSTSILPLNELAKVERLTHMYKMITCKVKHNFAITYNGTVHEHRTRQMNNIYTRNPFTLANRRSKDSSNAALMTVISEFNDLDNETRQLRSVKSFRQSLRIIVMGQSLKFNFLSPYLHIN